MYPLKQSTTLTVPIFLHDANGDAVTGIANGSFTKRISKDGGAFAAMTVTITEMENGWYSVPLSASHTDTLGLLSLTFTAAGAKQANAQFRIFARAFDDLLPTASYTAPPSAVTNAAAVWDEARAGHTTAGSFGQGVASVQGSVTGSVGSVTGAVGSVTGAVTVGTNNDKTGYALSAPGIQAIWDVLTSALTAVGSVGRLLVDNIDTNIASRLPTASYTAPPSAAVNADAVWDEARAGHTTAGSFGQGVASVQGNVTGSTASVTAGVTVSTNNDKSGYSLSGAAVQAIWDALTSALTTAGSIGKKLTDWALGSDNRVLVSANAHTSGETVAAVTGNVGGNVNGSVGSLGGQAKTDVNAELLDVLAVDTNPELTGLPPAVTTIKGMLCTLYAYCTNKVTETDTVQTLRNRADSATIATHAVSDDGSTYTRGSGS